MPDPSPGAAAAAAPPAEGSVLRRLATLREAAARDLLALPLKPVAANLRGFVESVAVDPSGVLWVTGWLARDQPLEFAAILFDGKKHPAAISLTSFPRADLPPQAHAVFGAILTDWRPAPATEIELYLFFGEGLALFQRGLKPVRVVEPKAALEQFEQVRASCDPATARPLQRMLTSAESWLPDTARAGGNAQANVDRILLLGGFGCLVEGWAFSPTKRIEGFALKFGETVLHSDPLTAYHKPRTDLAESFPDYGPLLDRAGFIAAFRGLIDVDDVSEPILKVVFTDGTSANQTVPAAVLRRLGHSAPAEAALALYPSLRHEAFFADFARALQREAVQRLGGIEAWHIAPAANVVVLAVPGDRSDAFLLAEEVRHAAAANPTGAGFLFLAERGAVRPLLLNIFAGLAASLGVPCSLCFVEDIRYAFHLLPTALRAVGAERFLFLAPGVFLTPAGWQASLAVLHGADPALHIFEVPAEAAAPLPAGAADCFAWTTAGFAALLPQLPLFLEGQWGDNGLTQAGSLHRHGPSGWRLGDAGGGSALTGWVNAALEMAHG